jgi:hypothetical protein
VGDANRKTAVPRIWKVVVRFSLLVAFVRSNVASREEDAKKPPTKSRQVTLAAFEFQTWAFIVAQQRIGQSTFQAIGLSTRARHQVDLLLIRSSRRKRRRVGMGIKSRPCG